VIDNRANTTPLPDTSGKVEVKRLDLGTVVVLGYCREMGFEF
jgi:hypothetical protein